MKKTGLKLLIALLAGFLTLAPAISGWAQVAEEEPVEEEVLEVEPEIELSLEEETADYSEEEETVWEEGESAQ